VRINVINPNTSNSMTDTIAAAARSVASPGTQIIATNPSDGPASIESHFDEAVCSVALLEQVMAGEHAGMDAYVIACFGDPGLLAAREIARAPVLGIAEAAMHVASMIATRFSIVTTLDRTKIISRHLVRNYGMEHHCARIRATGIEVLELETNTDAVFQSILAECQQARDEEDIGAIVLGCGGMAHLVDELQQQLGLPVIDGVVAAVKLAEALVGLGLNTSKAGDLDYPSAKHYRGKFAHFSPPRR